ncbi:ATP-binding protein [Oryzibacter oryziterrae]|uniref:ATP-binding protein n=1 Tax=Oryzibacter oryziterrae TaxID=2766474 RepID=UPI001F486AE2|nr:ATP-binding protein [Oryzibacter oryziterrae]
MSGSTEADHKASQSAQSAVVPVLTMGEIWRTARHLSTALALILFAFLWGGTYLYLNLDREKSLQGAAINTGNMARVFEEHVARSIKDIDQTLLFLRQSYETGPENFDLPSWTASGYLLHDLVLQISLIGPDGMLLTTNMVRNPDHVDLSDREHFKVHALTTADNLFISKPVLGRASGKWSVQLTRRVSKPDGSFGGVLVASLDPFYLSRFFQQIDLGNGGAITLVGDDGLIRARGGLDTDLLGKSIKDTPLFAAATKAGVGTFTDRTQGSDGSQLVSFRHMPDFPLIVMVSMAESEILAGYDRTRTMFLSIAGALSALLALVMVIGIVHQIRLARAQSAQQQSEARVASKSQELEATLAHMSQGIVMLDADRRIRILNRSAGALLGLSANTPAGTRLPTDICAFLKCQDTADNAVREETLADGTELEILSTPMPDGGVLHTLTDITARKRNEKHLAEARDRAEAASRAKTAFLATMSHEIRTPLNGVIGMTELLKDATDPAERADYARMMCQSAAHLQQIIEDVLDVSRLEADRITFESIDFDLRATVQSAADIVAPRAREKQLVLGVEIAADVPHMVKGDPRRLRQIVLNLVGNAVKFTEFGMVRIRVDRDQRRPGDTGDRLRIRVQDTGIGIATESLGDLFKEFSQLDGSITRRFGGTGLGLAITAKLLEHMGGDIFVDSCLGEGSTFTISLPITAASAAIADVAEAVDQILPPAPADGTGPRLLLVEDDKTNTLVASRLLTRLGYVVTCAGDGIEALEALDHQRFDIVLMDLMMPRMDGLSAIREIRTGGRDYAKVPIVVLTADALSDDRERAIALGVDGFATKPVDTHSLRDILAEALRRDAEPIQPTPMTMPEDAAGNPVLDRTILDRLCQDIGAEDTRVVARIFLTETDNRINLLKTRFLDAEDATREFHSIKSSSASFGLLQLSSLAATLQKQGKAMDRQQLAEAIETLSLAFTAAREQLEASETLAA